MKNIWKLLMIALMALAMVGCPADGNKDDDGDDEQPVVTTTTVAQWTADDTTIDTVFSMTLPIDDISTAWGGSPAAPAFSIMLMNNTAIAAMQNGTIDDTKKLPANSPAYQIQGNGNITFFSADDGTWKTNYNGVVAQVSDTATNVTVYFDAAQILKSQLKGIGLAFGTKGEAMITTEDEVDLTGYTAVAIALPKGDLSTDDTFTTDYPYIAEQWSASLFKMKSGATFPTSLQDPPASVSGIKIVVSINPEAEKADEKAVFTITNVSYYSGYKIPVNFYANGAALTVENAAANATLNVVLTDETTDVPMASWELAEKPTAATWTYAISKKIKIGGDEGWVGFANATNSEFDWTKRK